jgi:Uma2 family endonuclease
MPEVAFESTATMSPAEFAAWVEQRAGWDLNHYELLNGRIATNPPAGFPHGSIGHRVQRILGAFVAAQELRTASPRLGPVGAARLRAPRGRHASVR